MQSQCGILFIGECGKDKARIGALQSLGFRVDESADLPPIEKLSPYHAIVVRAPEAGALTMIGTRLRGRPHFGRRALLALVAHDASERECRDARMCGFDEILLDACSARDIAAQILRLLRGYPSTAACFGRRRAGARRRNPRLPARALHLPVAVFAVGVDRRSVFRRERPVMAAETAVRRGVPGVVGISAPRHFHR